MKPIIHNINAFDAKKSNIITFVWTGNQVFKNACTIRNNITNQIIYQQTQDTIQLKHDIHENALINGILYNITIKVFDKDGNASEESEPVLFYCFTTPSFRFINLIDSQIILNSSYQLILDYSQIENEEIQSYQFNLYNLNKNQIWSSGIKYDTTSLTATITGLDDNGTYYVRATGITINGMSLDTGYIPISVNYEMPSMYSIVTLENKDKEGMIKIQSNIISLSGKYVGDEPLYIDDEFIDLTTIGNYVYFDEGFSLDNNFMLNIKGKNFSDFTTILELTNGEYIIKLCKKSGTYISEGNTKKYYFDLQVFNKYSSYIIQSDFFDSLTSDDICSIWIKRVNNVYELKVIKLVL